MNDKKERLKQRNKEVRETYFKVKKNNPKWSDKAVTEEVAKKFFLAVRTVNAIIGYEGNYK